MGSYQWIDGFEKKEIRSLSKIISYAENGELDEPTIEYLATKKHFSHIIGITGPAGAGKSTFIGKLIDNYAPNSSSSDLNIGLILVDPTSPFTSGALLGDRLRMMKNINIPGIFTRSVATRGSTGGIAISVTRIVRVLEAFGMDRIIIETVGSGQSDLDVSRVAHTTLIVLHPGAGDYIQALKAGIMEIGHGFVINKKDSAGFHATDIAIRDFVKERNHQKNQDDWIIPVFAANSIENEGIKEVKECIDKHYQWLHSFNKWADLNYERARFQLEKEMETFFKVRLYQKSQTKTYQNMIKALYDGNLFTTNQMKEDFNKLMNDSDNED